MPLAADDIGGRTIRPIARRDRDLKSLMRIRKSLRC
jgi:hypothetical protein